MSIALAFWIIMLVALVGGGWTYRARANEAWPFGVVWLLIVLLGWAVFGAPIRG